MEGDLNTALALARQFKNYFRSFERAEEFLRTLAAAHSEAERIQSVKEEMQAEVAELDRQLQVLRGREAEARAQAERAEAESRERIAAALREAETVERRTRESMESAVAKYKANAEKVIEDLDRQIAELRAKCDEEKRRYEAAVKQREELLRSLSA